MVSVPPAAIVILHSPLPSSVVFVPFNLILLAEAPFVCTVIVFPFLPLP